MKIQLTIVILTLTTLITVGQDRTLTVDSDIAFWFKYYKEVRSEIGLEPTNKIQSEFYFRINCWDQRLFSFDSIRGIKKVDFTSNNTGETFFRIILLNYDKN